MASAGPPTAGSIFGKLTPRQLRTLMTMIGDSIHATTHMADMLDDMTYGIIHYRAIEYHNLQQELCGLHSELFGIICPEYAHSPA